MQGVGRREDGRRPRRHGLRKQFDHVELERLAVTEEEMDEAERLVSPELKDALRLAHDNIGKFHASQRFETTKVEVRPG